ncbi:MAG TPA: hypothetical protein VGJ00_07735 [Rhabdochlamydiaceae bacterium]|jgi:hypothetical protein
MKLLFVLLLFFNSVILNAEKITSYPYLSGDTWRDFCDWKLDQEIRFLPKKVKRGDTIFVPFSQLTRFQKHYLPQIKHKFILISANYEYKADSPHPGLYGEILRNEKVVAWFLQNFDGNPSSKIVPIPIGIANNEWPHGNVDLLTQFIKTPLYDRENKILAYVNFLVNSNIKEREPCINYFSQMPWAHIASERSFEEYLSDLKHTYFVISPPGHGEDCHRTWEALYMGCYPVVKHSTLDSLYEGLPVVCVNDWNEVTLEFLLEKQSEFSAKSWAFEKLYARYWFNKVRAIQRKLRK